jgi:hypothetical protein
VSAATVPAVDADLTAGLRRLKLAAMRQLAPELLVTAKTQRWTPEEVLRALVEAEITARDDSNARARLKAATFPVVKTTDEFDLAASSIPAPTWAYLTSLEWIHATENLALIGPAGTGKSHTLIALGHAAVLAGHRVRYLTAADLVETLYRGLADNTVGKTSRPCCATTSSWSTRSASPRWTTPAPSCCSGSSPPPTNAAPSASPHTTPSRTGDGSCPSTPPPSPCSTGSCTTPPPSSPTASPTACAKPVNVEEEPLTP